MVFNVSIYGTLGNVDEDELVSSIVADVDLSWAAAPVARISVLVPVFVAIITSRVAVSVAVAVASARVTVSVASARIAVGVASTSASRVTVGISTSAA
jgi:hypothetical protein